MPNLFSSWVFSVSYPLHWWFDSCRREALPTSSCLLCGCAAISFHGCDRPQFSARRVPNKNIDREKVRFLRRPMENLDMGALRVFGLQLCAVVSRCQVSCCRNLAQCKTAVHPDLPTSKQCPHGHERDWKTQSITDTTTGGSTPSFCRILPCCGSWAQCKSPQPWRGTGEGFEGMFTCSAMREPWVLECAGHGLLRVASIGAGGRACMSADLSFLYNSYMAGCQGARCWQNSTEAIRGALSFACACLYLLGMAGEGVMDDDLDWITGDKSPACVPDNPA